jgi:uncharacterized protein
MIPLELPLFPQFEKIHIASQKTIMMYVNQFVPYSDFNFVSLFSYDVENDVIVSNLNGNLVVRFRDYITGEPFYSFLGNHTVAGTIEMLLDLSLQEELNPVLKLIPSIVVEADAQLGEVFHIVEQRDEFDYILSSKNLRELSGMKFTSHRKLINRFHRRYPHFHIEDLDLCSPEIKDQVINLFVAWEKHKGKSREDTEHELTAIMRLLAHADTFSLLSFGVYLDAELVGFLIADLDHPTYTQVHFAKSNPLYTQIYYVLLHYLGRKLEGSSHELINIEQDLGIPGLRFAKEHWNPVHYLKKYTIKRKEI